MVLELTGTAVLPTEDAVYSKVPGMIVVPLSAVAFKMPPRFVRKTIGAGVDQSMTDLA